MNIAFFDFDGTITKKDTLIDFIIFAVGIKTFVLKLILIVPYLILYKIKIISNSQAKEKVLEAFFKGWETKTFNEVAHCYSLQRVPHIIRSIAKNKIEEHQQKGDIIVVVTASCQNWVQPWCSFHGLDCIATKLQEKDGKLTGKFNGNNCYGKEKVLRIKEKYNLKEFEKIFAYGDSKGDNEMLALAHEGYYKLKRVL